MFLSLLCWRLLVETDKGHICYFPGERRRSSLYFLRRSGNKSSVLGRPAVTTCAARRYRFTFKWKQMAERSALIYGNDGGNESSPSCTHFLFLLQVLLIWELGRRRARVRGGAESLFLHILTIWTVLCPAVGWFLTGRWLVRVMEQS